MQDCSTIELAHGSGGSLMADLILNEFVSTYMDKSLYIGDDATVLSNLSVLEDEKLVMSSDSFVVNPLFFPGGDIGRLAVCGTVNDISTSGARPVALSVSFIIEEGFKIEKLHNICSSIAKAAIEASISIVTGDTKVVEKGKCDGIFINTAGVGIVKKNKVLSGRNIKPNDVVLISGTVGDHGICIMSKRDGFSFDSQIESDCAPLNSLVSDVLSVCPNTRCFRDPTRGGVASTLNEFAKQSCVDITINQIEVPVKKQVKSACELLGLDVFHVANEGKMVCIVPPEQADDALSVMRANKYGKEAAIIGCVDYAQSSTGRVFVQTEYKTKRILDMLAGSQLPRIC